MIIGVPSEVKDNEFRVGLTPGNVSGLVAQGHAVLIQRGAGQQIGLMDELYRSAGASLVESATEVYAKSQRSEERSVGKECRSRWSPYH